MKKQLFGYILAGFLLISIAAISQKKDYPIKKVNGIEYYQYTVQTSEGLFAIGRKFEVSPDEISKANPEIKNGLRAGQEILIPVSKKGHVQIVPEKEVEPRFVEHKVEKKQTLFAISRKYDVSQEDIKKYNPDITKGLQEGMMLKIPLKEAENKKKEVDKNPVKTTKPEKEAKKNTIVHVVQADETLYSISRKYNVEVAEVIKLNPASATTLSIGTTLKIPANDSVTISTTPKQETVVNTTKQEFDINKLFDTSTLTKASDKAKIMRIGFLLPFMLDQDKKDPSVDRFVDFYSGALIAIQEAKQKGISFEIHTFDTEKSEEKLQEVLSNSELKTMDLIIGPVFSNQVSMISDFSKENRINTLIPFSSKVADIDTNPYLFQFNPGTDTELNFATELFTGKYKNLNIIFAEVPGVSSMDEGKIWAEGLQKELKRANKSFTTLALTTSDVADFSSSLKPGQKNLIIFNTDKFAYINPFLGSLKSVSSDFEVVLYEQFSWKNQNDKLPKGMFISPFISNINAEKLNQYNKVYSNYYGKTINKESPRYDLLGYDLSNYFIALFQRYGNKFTDKIGAFNFTDGLQSKPHFERISNGSGFVNQRVYLGED